MNIEDLRTFCLSFPATEERLPFNPDYLVFFVYDKMFCLIDITDPHDINLKCAPGYHMNKKHWNTVRIDGSLPDSLIEEWITDSYNLMVMGLPKKVRQELSSYKNQ